MQYEEFCITTPEEFSYIYGAYDKERTERYQDNWERMRMLAAITLQPYAKKGITPRRLLPLPWDDRKPMKEKPVTISKEEAVRAFETVLEKAGN